MITVSYQPNIALSGLGFFPDREDGAGASDAQDDRVPRKQQQKSFQALGCL